MQLKFSKTRWLFTLGLPTFLLTTAVYAGGKSFFVAEDASKKEEIKKTIADNDDEGLEATIEQNFSPEDRIRLRKALSEYARNNDPVHNQIELKRKQMQESIKERFDGCNKDNDDSLDRAEATQCLPQVARHFNYVDVDEDGVITLDELQLTQSKMQANQKALEAKLEAQRVVEEEAEIKKNSKNKINKQAVNNKKRPG